MKKTFTLGVFFFSLIFFGFFLFNQSVFATTIFSEDFDNFNLDDSTTELSLSDNWIILNSDSLKFIIDDTWYSSFPYSARLLSSSSHLSSKLFDTITSGSFFYTFTNLLSSSSSSQLILCSGSCDSFKYLAITFSFDSSFGYIRSKYDYSVLASFPLSSNGVYEIQVDFNLISSEISIFVNDSLIIDNAFLSQHYKSGSFSGINSFSIAFSSNYSIFVDDIYLTDGSNPFTFNRPDCGSDAGKLIETTPSNLCDVGTAGTVTFDGSKWSWDCVSGAVSRFCRAYLATTAPVDGTCGAWDGETFNTWPPLDELCELRASLVVPSMVETINGYTWTCSGINGGTSDYCSGNKTPPPSMPELPAGSLDDCSGLSILEGLICNIGNTLKTIFLPSSEKINELNQTINKMSGKFPFSYISKAMETFNDVKGNITETSILELSIMESEKSSIDFSTIAFFDYIKKLTTILIIIVFSFWLIRFIKHIF